MENRVFPLLEEANLEESPLWQTSFAVKELTATEEQGIAALVKKVVSGGLSAAEVGKPM